MITYQVEQDAIFTQDNSNVQYDVREGDVNRKILGFRVVASGSDIALRDINVSFTNDQPVIAQHV